MALTIIVVLYMAVGFLAAAGSIFISQKLFSARREQIFFALFFIAIAGFYLAFTAYFGNQEAWRLEIGAVIAFTAFGILGLRFPVALMFVADKPAAVSEMRRVVTANGRVLISVWQGLDRHPFYETLHNVIQRRVGMSALHEIFALGDEEDLRELALEAGFRQLEIKPFSLKARFPNPEAFIAGEIEVDTAAIPAMQHLDSNAREAIVRTIAKEMQSPLEELTSDNHVAIPFHGLIMVAQP